MDSIIEVIDACPTPEMQEAVVDDIASRLGWTDFRLDNRVCVGSIYRDIPFLITIIMIDVEYIGKMDMKWLKT